MKVFSFPDHMPTFPEGKTITLVGGVFDLIHIGHLDFLLAAKKLGDILVVALESEDMVLKSKNRTPVHSQAQRAEILSNLYCVDSVIQLPHMEGFEDYLKLVKSVHPQFIAVTEGEPYLEEKEKQAQAIGAKVVPVNSRLAGYSTTDILKHYCN
jgi:cytidyltransferase-like protein